MSADRIYYIEIHNLLVTCDAIEKGYADGLTLLDDEMVHHASDLADSTGLIKALANAYLVQTGR